MSTVTPKPLVDGALLADTEGTLYTVPAATTAVARSITLCNTGATTRMVTLFVVPSGGAADAAHRIFNDLTIEADKTIVDDTLRVLLTGGTIRGFADVGNEVAIRVDGSEVT
ncbi:MAG TPA: hypothetical protein VLA89_12390 [Gemmatimonadales bacterium]|nr:hypothetical protein [Gemmatimonadales bacterium]